MGEGAGVTAGLAEVRDWLGGFRSASDVRRQAERLVLAVEAQEAELEVALRLLEAVLRAKVMGPGWERSALKVLGKGEMNGSLR